MEYVLHRVLGFIKAAHVELDGMRRDEIPPDVGRILNAAHRFGRYALLLFADEMLIQVRFGRASRLFAFVHDMKRIELFVFGIDAIGGESSAEAVAPIVHQGDGLQDIASVMQPATSIHDPGNGAPGGYPDIAFS